MIEMSQISLRNPMLPQYEDEVFIDKMDCPSCSRLGGMVLRRAWLSLTEKDIMNIQFECSSCHKRIWSRIALPEVKVGYDKS